MNKIILWLTATAALVGSGFVRAQTQSFTDNFNDGNMNGWEVAYGNWKNSGKELVDTYNNFGDNYGSIRLRNSFGSYQRATVDFFWPSFSEVSYTAGMLLRSQSFAGDEIHRHGYIVLVSGPANDIQMGIANYTRGNWENIAIAHIDNPHTNAWHTLSFEVSGKETQIRLKAWLDGYLKLDTFDTTDHPHNTGAIALASGNHLSTGMRYDNFRAFWSSQPSMAVNSPLFRLRVLPCGNPGTNVGCGSNPAAGDPLKNGELIVYEQGKVRVSLNQATPNKTYLVSVQNWSTAGSAQAQFAGNGNICNPTLAEIGAIKTNAEGNFTGLLTDPATGEDFVFPTKTTIGQPNFAFNDPDCSRTQFTTGFTIP